MTNPTPQQPKAGGANSESELDKILDHKPVENVPDDIWETIHATWTGLWTDAYGEWDEKQPSDLYPISDLLSEKRLQSLKAAILAWHHQQLEAKTPEPSNGRLREIDPLGYEHYRYQLDMIYNSGSIYKNHYRQKDAVDDYIVGLVEAKVAEARVDELDRIPQALEQIEHKLGTKEMVRLIKLGKSAWDIYLPERRAHLTHTNNKKTAPLSGDASSGAAIDTVSEG